MPFKRPESGSWYTDFVHPQTGRRIKKAIKGCTDKRMAQAHEAKMIKEIMNEEVYGITTREKITVRDFIEQYFNPRHATDKVEGYEIYVNKVINKYGDLFLHEVKESSIEQDIKERRKKVSGAAVNKEYGVLKTIFNKAYEWNKKRKQEGDRMWKLPEFNPMEGIKKEAENRRTFYYNFEDMRTLFAHCSLRLRKFLLVILLCGLRKGEVQNISEEDMDFHSHLLKLPKTKSQTEQIVPTSGLLEMLLKEEFKKEKRPFDYNPKRALNEAIADSKLEIPKGCKFHVLRHTFATYLSNGGVDDQSISKILRHDLKGKNSTWIYIHSTAARNRWVVEKAAEILVENILKTDEIGATWEAKENDVHNIVPAEESKVIEISQHVNDKALA